MRLLLVEDSKEFSALIAAGLRRAGFAIDEVSTAGDAKTALANVAYSALVLDLGLPDDDGLNIVAELRRQNNRLPVLVLTARNGLDIRIESLKKGADDYMTKPFEMDELVARV